MRRYRGPLMFVTLISAGVLHGCSGCMQAPTVSCNPQIDLFGDGGCFLLCPPDGALDTGGPSDTDLLGDAELRCREDLPPGYICAPIVERPAGTSCTDEAIDALLSCFAPGGDEAKCKSARAAHPACATCMLGDRDADGGVVGWLDEYTIDEAACVHAIDPTSPCTTAVGCTKRCVRDSCFACSTVPASGTSASDYDRCVASVVHAPLAPDAEATGDTDAEADVADTSVEDASDTEVGDAADAADALPCDRFAGTEYHACLDDPRFRVCFPSSLDALRVFFRGACRDGAKWPAGDAGSDAAAD